MEIKNDKICVLLVADNTHFGFFLGKLATV